MNNIILVSLFQAFSELTFVNEMPMLKDVVISIMTIMSMLVMIYHVYAYVKKILARREVLLRIVFNMAIVIPCVVIDCIYACVKKFLARMKKIFPHINVVIVISRSDDSGDHRHKKSKLFKQHKRRK